MMCVDVFLAPSPLHGLGVHTRAPIAAGTVVWRFLPGFDQVYTREQFQRLPPRAQAHVRWYGHHDQSTPELIYLCADLAVFMNYSDTAYNLTDTLDTNTALRDIAAGEELLFNPFAASPLYRAGDYQIEFG